MDIVNNELLECVRVRACTGAYVFVRMCVVCIMCECLTSNMHLTCWMPQYMSVCRWLCVRACFVCGHLCGRACVRGCQVSHEIDVTAYD